MPTAGTKAVGAATGRERVGAAETPAEPDEADGNDGTAAELPMPVPAFDAPKLAVGELNGEFSALEFVVAVVAAGATELVEPELEPEIVEPEFPGAAEV